MLAYRSHSRVARLANSSQDINYGLDLVVVLTTSNTFRLLLYKLA